MAIHLLAAPVWRIGEDPDVAAARYAEAFANHEERLDRAAGLPPACSRAARPGRIEAATNACLRYWQRQRDIIDAEFGGTE